MIQTHSKKTSGFTLIELMITVGIMTLILSGVLQYYLSALSQQVLAQAIQDRALQRQLLLTELQTSFHNAGYFGCRSFRGYFIAFEINPKHLPRSILQRKVQGSDVVKLRYLDPDSKPAPCVQEEKTNLELGALVTEYWYIRRDKHALYRQIQSRAERIADHIESLKAVSEAHEMQITLNWELPKQQETLWFALLNLT